MSPCCCVTTTFLFAFLILSSFSSTIAGFPDPSPNTANLSASWTNSGGELWLNSPEGMTVEPILRSLRETGAGPAGFLCGFYCHYHNNSDVSCLFAILIFQNGSSPQPVWSANRNRPVGLNATLLLTEDGNLILVDADGSFVWSTDTSNNSVSALNLTENGNLMLINGNSEIVWQSFDHPTDSLVLQQKLVPGKELISGVSASDWSQGSYSLSITNDGVVAYIHPPQLHYLLSESNSDYVKYDNGSLSVYYHDDQYEEFDRVLFGPIPKTTFSAQYMRLESDGHLRVYQWKESSAAWEVAVDLTAQVLSECQHPLACGNYGICSAGHNCTCPVPAADSANYGTIYFRPIDERQPQQGCSLITPISCQSSQYHTLLELGNTTYFRTSQNEFVSANVAICKQTCLNNCSCKAALFTHYDSVSSIGYCSLLSEVFSLKKKLDTTYHSTMFLKVDNSPIEKNAGVGGNAVHKKARNAYYALLILISSFGVSILIFCIGGFLLLLWKIRDSEDAEHDNLDCISGMLTKFSCEDLKAITKNFSYKLGQGGFGSVFQGTLSNGIQVAVKRLEGLGQMKKSFLAEVETIGSIHHVNLVRLIGFCTEKSHRLLVYEYMCNGSLDKWIFHGNQQLSLGWECRRKIILDIAKGLSYLHEDCRKKIIHLDIKPQNILLDEDFNAKVADFGLSKLIDKDQSRQIVTTMRGTPGYLAPEWLSSSITEKVDVYSFGVVVLEIICGRKNIDRSQIEEDMHLLAIFKRRVEENRLIDMIDKCNEDMQLHEEDVMEMMKLGAWCLQSDFARRPSMSMVVKVLEGSMGVQDNLDYNFSYSPLPPKFAGIRNKVVDVAATIVIPSALSGPR